MAAWTALSLVPDADVVGFLLGVEYRRPVGSPRRDAFADLLRRRRSHARVGRTMVQPARPEDGAHRKRRTRQPCAARHDDRRRPGLRVAVAVRSLAVFRAVAPDSGCADRVRHAFSAGRDGRSRRAPDLRAQRFWRRCGRGDSSRGRSASSSSYGSRRSGFLDSANPRATASPDSFCAKTRSTAPASRNVRSARSRPISRKTTFVRRWARRFANSGSICLRIHARGRIDRRLGTRSASRS